MFHNIYFWVLLVNCVYFHAADGYECLKTPKVRFPYCQDKNEARKGHTLCLGGIRQHYMNDTVKSHVIDLHQNIRLGVNPPAADMTKMESNPSLELEAQIWAEQCNMGHDKPELRFLADRFSVGQNIYVGGPSLNWTEAIDHWEQGRSVFTYGGTNNKSAVINYVQMISAETHFIGCGVSKCGSQFFYVCNYAPSFDDSRLNTPYLNSTSGKWCDSCPGRCDNSTHRFCDCKGKLCVNGGRLNFTTCQCECISTVQTYDNEFCALICKPNGDDTRCGTPPYDNSSCLQSAETDFLCPWMCNICPYAGVNYTEGSELLPWEVGLPVCTTTTTSTITTTSTTTTSTSIATTNSTATKAAFSVTTKAIAATSHKVLSPLSQTQNNDATQIRAECQIAALVFLQVLLVLT